jgi:hypothetical protein
MSVASERTPDIALPKVPAWSWVHVAVAALAMVLTLPGRTQGLGLFTEPLLRSLALDREQHRPGRLAGDRHPRRQRADLRPELVVIAGRADDRPAVSASSPCFAGAS